jgi:hypothetical protein
MDGLSSLRLVSSHHEKPSEIVILAVHLLAVQQLGPPDNAMAVSERSNRDDMIGSWALGIRGHFMIGDRGNIVRIFPLGFYILSHHLISDIITNRL